MDNIKVKGFFNQRDIVFYIDPNITLEKLNKEVSELWQFDSDQLFTIKWIDDEGDPCLITSQDELDEMLRLHDRADGKEREVILHVFKNQPMMPGMPCPGEDGNIYRRGAARWRKKTKYKIYGHIYEPKRLKSDTCAYCQDKIWGLGSGGFKCINCKLMVHKKCHKKCKVVCGSRATSGAGILNDGTNASGNNNNTLLPRLKNNHQFLVPTFPSNQSSEQNIDGEQDEGSPHYKLEDFELLKVIGRGSYAKVFMVELKKTKRIYAMKVIKKEMFVLNDNEDIDWVQTEKHVFESASNYPFLVGLHSCFQSESRLFFVIEFVRGGDLMYHMQRKRRLAEPEAQFYSAEISLALDFLHTRGIIYRDLKLDNVLIDHEGHIKLTDYGMCKEGIKKGEKTNTFCGTPNYISPELLRAEDYDFSVDWWALGVLLYEMLAGKSPFDTQDSNEDALFQTILEKTIRIPRSLSVRAQNILRDFLKKDPSERLGCDPDKGFLQIKQHEFFRGIDWEQLERRQVKPPYTPPTTSDRDLAHFDDEFTRQSVCFTPDNPELISRLDQSEFEGFEYVNPLLMSSEDIV
jgi:atypical protein kinase C iota type